MEVGKKTKQKTSQERRVGCAQKTKESLPRGLVATSFVICFDIYLTFASDRSFTFASDTFHISDKSDKSFSTSISIKMLTIACDTDEFVVLLRKLIRSPAFISSGFGKIVQSDRAPVRLAIS